MEKGVRYPHYLIKERSIASASHAQLQGELDELKTKLAELSRKIDGPKISSPGPAPERPPVLPTTEGSAHTADLALLQAKIEHALAKMAEIKLELAKPLWPARHEQLLKEFDSYDQIFQECSKEQRELVATRDQEDRDIAIEEYQKFKSDRKPLSPLEDSLFRGHVFDEYITPTEGMPEAEIEAYMNQDMRRLDHEMILAVRRLRGLIAERAPRETIAFAATEVDNLMTCKRVMEKEFAIKREAIRKQSAIEREEDRRIAAEEYKKFRSQRKPMSDDEKQTILEEVNRRIGLEPGMSDADILSRMDSEMPLIDERIVFANRLYREMLKDRTATPELIEQEARELENWMTLKMVLEEQIANHSRVN